MSPDQFLAGQFVDRGGEPLRKPAGVDEDDGRPVLPDQLENAGMDGRPDAPARSLLVICPPPIGGRVGVGGITLESAHVLDRHADALAHRAADVVDMLVVQDREQPSAQIGAGLP